MSIVLFDGICNLCDAAILFLIKHDTNNHLLFAALQTEPGKKIIQQYAIEDHLESVILIKDEKVYYQSDAIIQIAKIITGWPRILQYISFFPKGFRDAVYNLIARNRYRIFGKKNNCSIPSQSNLKKFL